VGAAASHISLMAATPYFIATCNFYWRRTFYPYTDLVKIYALSRFPVDRSINVLLSNVNIGYKRLTEIQARI
jgi:hypothetical protein